MRLTLLVMAAGRSTRFGRPKQLEPVGPSGERLFEYGIHDAVRSGVERIVFVTRPDLVRHLQTYVRSRLGPIPYQIVLQQNDDLPTGFRPPLVRGKPWGSAHAVLAARDAVREPFIVINADDFYGPSAVSRLAGRLRDALTTGDPSHFVAGYQLHRTSLSAAGGVNRALLVTDRALVAERIDEITGITDCSAITDSASAPRVYGGVDPDGEPIELTGYERVSMNAWGFQPSIFETLWHGFGRFHSRIEDPERDEYALSTAIGDLIAAGRCRVRVEPIEDEGHAMTFTEDRDAMVSAVNRAVAAGHYPTDMARWFDRRRGNVPG